VIELNEPGNPITSYRKEIRAGLLGLAVPVVIIGGWALLAPHGWYDEFPVGSGRWISSLGPYDEHLARDFGALYLALGLLLGFAAFALDRLLVKAVLWASLVFQVPHLIFHVANTEPFSAASNIANLALLGLGLVLTAMLLDLVSRRQSATVSEPASIEGGIGYGTR
jgi:hypothetical protein